jgi:hypothetical protein
MFRTLPVARPIWSIAILRLQAENSVVASNLLRFPKVSLENVSLVKLIKDGFGRVVSGEVSFGIFSRVRSGHTGYECSLKPGDNAQGEGLTVSQRNLCGTSAITIEFGSDGVGHESGKSDNRTIN